MTYRKQTPAPCGCFALRVWQHADLEGPWAGWRLRGRYLVAPGGERLNAQRLVGMLLEEALRLRLAKARKANCGHQVGVVVPWPGAGDLVQIGADQVDQVERSP